MTAHRAIGKAVPPDFGLPEPGWCNTSKKPPVYCSWCEALLLPVKSIVACPQCDSMNKWPNPEII